jgi:single-strand DNA-binding protein
MYNINTAQIEGNLTRDPELKSLPSGAQVTNMSIATNRKWKDKDGNLQEATEYHNVVVFGKQAESVAKYLTKGSSCYVTGRLETRSWEADGHKQYRTEIIASDVSFGAKPQPSKVAGTSVDYPEATDTVAPEDIPF